MQILILLLSVIVILCGANVINEGLMKIESKYEPAELVCRVKYRNNVTNLEIEAIKEYVVPETRSQQCFLSCILKRMGLMSSNNRIKNGTLKELMDPFQKPYPQQYKKALNVTQTCLSEQGGSDECEAAKNIMNCTVTELQKAGILAE